MTLPMLLQTQTAAERFESLRGGLDLPLAERLIGVVGIAVTGTWVSGNRIFDKYNHAGAFITLAASRCAAMPGSMPESMPT